ncbi:hypothetical protein PV797_02495 [Clostridiaceae bacterium M8S5]|nr:hypothetical protein PV797_02495 [Clostridiaceae bacterium M8S5]
MAKNTRGKNVKREAGWRGTCPQCKRDGVKLLWTGDNEQQVCKICGNEIK